VTGNAIISDVDALMYVILKIEKVPYGELVMTMYNAIDGVSHIPRSLLPSSSVYMCVCVCMFFYMLLTFIE